MTTKEKQICKLYNNAKGYNSAQDIENKLTYISIVNTTLECLVYTGVIDSYKINRSCDKIVEIVLLNKGVGTITIIID
jgi:hypothetical protein